MNRPRELSERTLAGYELQWSRFVEWSEARGITPMPATSEMVESYIHDMSGWGARVSTVKVATAAIARRHVAEELPNPCADPEVQQILTRLADGRLEWYDPGIGRHIPTIDDERATRIRAEARNREIEEELRRLRGK